MAEFRRGADLMAVTTITEGQLQLRIESRADGLPWLVDATRLARGLAEATRQIAACEAFELDMRRVFAVR